MIVASGKVNAAKIVDSIILMAKDENSIHELNQKEGPGTWKHPDGWGAAYLSKGRWIIKKSPKPIFEDPEVEKLKDINTNLLMVHVRKKAGSEVALENTHPFKTKHPVLGACVFCHNGYIQDEIAFDAKYKLQGQGDSEKLFYSILTDIKDEKAEKIIRHNLQKYSKTKGSNIILAAKEKTHVALRKNILPKYYGMSLGSGEGLLIISSERLKTFSDFHWKALNPGDVATIKNGLTEYKINKENLFQKIVTTIFQS